MTRAKLKKSRPGLGTSAGHEFYDTIQDVSFFRKPGGPDALASVHYNDKEGAKVMAQAWGGSTWAHGGSINLGNGRLAMKILLNGYSTCEHFGAGERQIIIGEPGQSWTMELKNKTDNRVEVVVSVDGLDVMDGGTANQSKRGYVIEKKSSIRISGWRVSNSRVKAFVFGTVDESKAALAGKPRNVGVIGLAIYDEDKAARKKWLADEAGLRGTATAFPGN